MAAARPTSDRWLFGPGSDLLLGCGLGYVAVFALLIATGLPQSNVLYLGLVPFVSVLTGTPHYGATLLRVYEQPAERRRYVFFAVYVTAFVWGLFYLGLYNALLGSLLLTLYLSWSPWHYSGQNYGIALMFLRRRGIAIEPFTKRSIYLCFLLSYLLTLIAVHGGGPDGAEYAAVQPYGAGVYHMMRLGIPPGVWEVLFGGVFLVYLGAIGVAGTLLLRRARPIDLLPSAVLVATQMLWFSLPPLARHWGLLGGFSDAQAAYAFFWIATGHMVQYLWITTFYAARSEGYGARARFFVKALAAGSFIWSVPALIYSLSVEGTPSGGIARGPDVFVLLASVVNLHHFILDGAIWKLRDGRVARVLIRSGGEPAVAEGPEPGPRRRWLAPVVYAVGGFATATVLLAIWEKETSFKPALRRGDLARAQRSLRWLDTLGHDSASEYLQLGRAAASLGDPGTAIHAYARSLEKHPNARVYVALARFYKQQGSPERAIAAYESALEHNPYDLEALYDLGVTLLQQGEPERALEPLSRAADLAPNHQPVAAALGRARERTATPEGAQRAEGERSSES